jgi:hypothetical protein
MDNHFYKRRIYSSKLRILEMSLDFSITKQHFELKFLDY